jgi:hypothetical protein
MQVEINSKTMKFKINPLNEIQNIAGTGYESLFPYKPQTDDVDYYNALWKNNSDFDGTTFRTDVLYGTPLADRWIDFDVDKENNICLTVEEPVLRISRPRLITYTQIAGLDYSIKEYICDGDFEITMNFMVAGLKNRPLSTDWDKMKMINQLCGLKKAVDVYSAILNNVFGIRKIVITSMADVTLHDQWNNIYNVSIEMKGDEDYEPFKKGQ